MVWAEALRQGEGSFHVGCDDISTNPAKDAGIGLAIADGVGVHGYHCMAFVALSIGIIEVDFWIQSL